MRKIRMLCLTGLLILVLTGCQTEVSDSTRSSPSSERLPAVEEESELPDLLVWAQVYLDAEDDFYEGGTVEKFETAISELVGEALLVEKLEEANRSLADISINGKVSSWADKAKLVFGKHTRRVEISTDFSPVCKDLNPERDFFQYVFVRRTYKMYDENGDLIPEMSHIRLYKYWFQKFDEEWDLYSVSEAAFFHYDGAEHTRDFNEEPIIFTHYKDFELNLKEYTDETDLSMGNKLIDDKSVLV